MKFYNRYIRPLFFSRRFFWAFVAVILLFVVSYTIPILFPVAKIVLMAFAVLVLLDYLVLFGKKAGTEAKRITGERFSNGDLNKVRLELVSHYPFKVKARLIDEIPDQFQDEQFKMELELQQSVPSTVEYQLRPIERGEYHFFDIVLFIRSPLGLIIKREKKYAAQTVKVYPAFFPLRQFELVAYSHNLSEAGSKKIRKIGHSLEFEQIKEYVRGDDYRSINWKATARRSQLMVNNFTDERSQQVYCFIDKGRVMKMPFKGMTLLDYAINASLILSRVALIRQDRAGLVTFSEEIGHFLPADRRSSQMNSIMETLYNQQTRYMESDYERLYALVRTRITQRSLIVLFTNFESMTGLERQLPFIRAIAKTHLVLVVFFENTELASLINTRANSIESLYTKTIAEKFAYEKRLMVKELQQHGISTILTSPENLTINTVNRYLELKARQAI